LILFLIKQYRSIPEVVAIKKYELAYEDNPPNLYLKKVRYYVEAIDYSNFMFEVLDAHTQKDGYFSISHRSLIEYKFNNKDYSPFNFGQFNNFSE